MALLALKMDVNNKENTGLQEENAFFDATHMQVFGFKSFGLGLVHSSMREMIRLASMEMRSENSKDIAIFFRLFNEMLEKVSGIPNYKFNPRCFLYDEAGANYKAVRIVYGDDFCKDRVCGCQFHFKQQIQKKKNEVGMLRETFIETCKQLCTVTTVAKYKILKGRLEEMAETVPTLYSWIEWWDDRRAQIFGPYRGGGLLGCNLSEQGNAQWKPTNTMQLVHAACDDVSRIFQEVKVYLFDRNMMRSTGRGRSKATRDDQDRAKQITVANDFIEAFSNPAAMLEQIWETLHPSSHIPKARSSFKPLKVNKNNEKKNAKEKPKQKQKRHNDVPPTSSSLDEMGKIARLTEKGYSQIRRFQFE